MKWLSFLALFVFLLGTQNHRVGAANQPAIEYKAIVITGPILASNAAFNEFYSAALNKEAANGWELVAVGYNDRYYFKRVKY